MLQSTGSWFTDKRGKLNLTGNPDLVESLRIMKKLHDSGILLETRDWNDWVSSITDGHVVSVINGVWITGTIKTMPRRDGSWMITTIPKLDTLTAKAASNQGGSSWYILRKGNNWAQIQQAISLFKNTFAKDDEFYQKILRRYGAIGTYLPSQNGNAYTKDYSFFVHQQIYLMFSQWMRQIPEVSYGKYTYLVNEAINKQMPEIYAGESIEKVLAKIQKNLEAAL